MINSIFKRLTPSTAEALRSKEVQILDPINVDELTAALSAVKSDLEIAHSGLQKIYEEANYVYDRLCHMERTMTNRSKPSAKKESSNSDEGGGADSSGSTQIIVEKAFVLNEGRLDERLAKIREAKNLTQDLLQSIEQLSLKVKQSNVLASSSKMKL